MSMATMVMIAGRKRDDRRAEDDERRMGNDHSTRMDYDTEMRRRRDERGRYMEEDARYWPEPHIPPQSGPSRMRDQNVVNIRDYMDKRRIGFTPRLDDDEEEPEMRKYGRRYDPDRPKMHHGSTTYAPQQMGMASADDDDRLTREEAEAWVQSMEGDDGKRGGRWKFNEVQQYAGNYGIQPEEVPEFFAVLNALYTDYGKVARKYGVDRMDFWADMAKAFIRDKDAQPGKVKLYYDCIAKHDD